MRQRLAQFMVGRNGNDQLNSFLILVTLALLILGRLFGGAFGSILTGLALAGLAVIYFRMLSKNVYRRREENGRFMQLRYRVSAKMRGLRERWVQRKDYKFFSCPACRCTLRVPRGHNKIRIVCKKCGHSFVGRS